MCHFHCCYLCAVLVFCISQLTDGLVCHLLQQVVFNASDLIKSSTMTKNTAVEYAKKGMILFYLQINSQLNNPDPSLATDSLQTSWLKLLAVHTPECGHL